MTSVGTLRWYSTVVDAADPFRLAIVGARVPDPKTHKNRLHLDLDPVDQGAEVSWLLDLGATRADVGQRDVRCVVLADPEGNEFCVLTPQEPPASV